MTYSKQAQLQVPAAPLSCPMHGPGIPRRKLATTFDDDSEITALPSPSEAFAPGMFGSTRLPIGAGPSYVNAIMGQGPSAAEREKARKANSIILREDSILVEQSEPASRQNSWSTHPERINAPPSPARRHARVNAQADLLPLRSLPQETRDLALFLRDTAPPPPPSPFQYVPPQIEEPERAVNNPKYALKFFKLGRKRAPPPAVLRDEGNLLMLPVQQKVSSTGKKYRAIQTAASIAEDNRAHVVSPSIQDSHVSILFTESVTSGEAYQDWLSKAERESRSPNITPVIRQVSASLPLDCGSTLRVVNCSSPSPIRREASNPPTPDPQSANTIAESYLSDLNEHPAKRSFDACRALSSHPVHPGKKSFSLPKLPLPDEEFPVKIPGSDKNIELEHPSPRRFASHPVLLQRATSIRSTLYARSVSDSPGPPPPKSPLRLKRDPRIMETLLADDYERKATPKIAPSIRTVNEYRSEIQPIQPTVTTDCTGPIPKSPITRKPVPHPTYTVHRRPREDQIRAYKLRDRPTPTQTIDAVVSAPPLNPRQRLRKARPHLQIPSLRPAPLATRASSTASSNGSGKKITEFTRTPISAVPSENTPASAAEKTGYTPISATTSHDSTNIGISPVMLVAEEIPLSKNKSTPKPARVMVKEGKSYAPRPRSASIPRNALRRRSLRMGSGTPSRPNSPAAEKREEEAPPLPSPPPNRALPPTPPASGSEKPRQSRLFGSRELKKDLPATPMYEISPKEATPPTQKEGVAHVATQDQRNRSASKGGVSKEKQILARLDYVEKRNLMLEAALLAVLHTNSELHGPAAALQRDDGSKGPSAWETRIARRSAVSHVASSSNGSALEMYMNTRRGSKHGC